MVDSVNVFPPGQRLTNSSTGAPLSGAVVKFFVAGTTTPKPVYADQDLTVALGTSVTTDSLGYPTSDGTTKTLVYTDTSAYKVRIETSTGTLIAEHDNVKGAVEAGTSGGGTVIETRTVETKSLDYTVLAADQGKAFAGNCSGGDVTFTLPSAAASDVGNGWLITINHAGSANQVIIATSSSQTITSGALNYGTALSLSNSGEEVTLISDGGNWRVFMHTGPHVKRGQGVFTVADRAASAPGAPPAQGTLYIATGSATWGSAAVVNHDIVLHTTAGAYVVIKPQDGWIAHVADEDENYQFQGSAWVQLVTVAATQAEQEAGTSLLKAVTPGRQHLHPSAAKCWATVTYAAGVPTLVASYNITSITDTAAGQLAITIATDFSSADWAGVAMAVSSFSSAVFSTQILSQTAGSISIGTFQESVGFADQSTRINFVGFGDHA